MSTWETDLKKHLQRRDDGFEMENLSMYIFDDPIGQHILRYISYTGMDENIKVTIVPFQNVPMDIISEIAGCPTLKSSSGETFTGVDAIVKLREQCDTMFEKNNFVIDNATPEGALLDMLLPCNKSDNHANNREVRTMV